MATSQQEYSIDEIRPGTLMYACTRKPVRGRADLELVAAYEPGMPDWTSRRPWRHAWRPSAQAVGDDGWVGVWAPHGPFNMASLLVDEQELYALFYEDPAYYERLMEVSLARVRDYTRAIDAPGVDILFIGGNVPGGFIGRRNYEQHVLPWEARHIAWAQAEGTPAAYHNCGQIQALVESYKKLGVAAVEPFSPPPKLGDADLAAAKALVGDAYVIIARRGPGGRHPEGFGARTCGEPRRRPCARASRAVDSSSRTPTSWSTAPRSRTWRPSCGRPWSTPYTDGIPQAARRRTP